MQETALSAAAASSEPTLLARIADSLQSLAARPTLLALLALALNALVQPYLGIFHDARLYALLVTNRVENGAFAHDLFLRYGSQDSYSLFSLLAAPTASVLGIPLTFFLGYLLSRALLVAAITTFVLRVFGAGPLTALSVLILAIDPIGYGGFGVFQVNEAFLTPRLPAIALTLFGLTAMLDRRWLVAVGCFLVGCLIHPLMAIVGFAMLAGWVVLLALPRRGFTVLLAVSVVGCLVVLGIPAVGYRLFGSVDAEWREQVCLVSVFNFPLHWREVDWRRLIVVIAVVATFAWLSWEANRERADLLRLALLIGLGGLLAMTVASEAGYRLLFQVQPYRALWLVHLLAVPCLVQLVVAGWAQSERSRVLVVVVLAALLCNSGLWVEWVLPAAVFAIAALGLRGVEPTARSPHWLSQALASGLIVGLALWGAFRFGITLTLMHRTAGRFDGLEVALVIGVSLGAVFFLLALLWVLTRLSPALRTAPARVGLVALALFFVAHISLFAVTQSAWYRQTQMAQGENARWVGEVLADRQPPGIVPTVYWANGRVERSWLDAKTGVYFDFNQLAGLLFNRETSVESYRRAQLVGPFELEVVNRYLDVYPESVKFYLERLHGGRIADAKADAEALTRLAREPILDYVVLERDPGVPFLATNGLVFLYDCRQLRAQAER